MIDKDNIRYLYGEPYRVVPKTKDVVIVDCNGSRVIQREYEVADTAPSPYGLIHLRKHLQPKNENIPVVGAGVFVDGNIEVGLRYQLGKGVVFVFDLYPSVQFKVMKRVKIYPNNVRYIMTKISGERTTETEVEVINKSKNIIVKNGM